MCIIIRKPAEVEFKRFWLSDFWERNRDGAGVMRVENGEVKISKITAPTLKEWLAFYDEHARGHSCIIHLRKRTRGEIVHDNTHPFYVASGWWLMHNGTLAQATDSAPERSDTWHFIESVLKPTIRRNRRALESVRFRIQLGQSIGNNRMVLMHARHGHFIINKRQGFEWRGAWFSNTYAWNAPTTSRRQPLILESPSASIYTGTPQPTKPNFWTDRDTLPWLPRDAAPDSRFIRERQVALAQAARAQADRKHRRTK